MGRGVYCLVNAPLGRHLGRPQRETFEREGGELPGGTVEQKWGGPSLMTVGLGADRNAAHCATIPTRATRYSPSRLLPPAVSFTVTTGLPPSGKKSAAATPSAPHSSLEVAGPTGEF